MAKTDARDKFGRKVKAFVKRNVGASATYRKSIVGIVSGYHPISFNVVMEMEGNEGFLFKDGSPLILLRPVKRYNYFHIKDLVLNSIPIENTYPHICSLCHSPSRKSICSNSKCKSWHQYRKLAITAKSIAYGLTSDRPIELLCPMCRILCNLATNRTYCEKCESSEEYGFVKGLWYKNGNNIKAFITQCSGYINNGSMFDYDNEIELYNEDEDE